MNTWKLSIESSLCDCTIYFIFKKDINKLTEDKKEGLRQLVLTFQHFMREEIQDASQLPPSFDIFEAFAKVSVNFGIFANAINQPFTPYIVVDPWKSRTLHAFISPLLYWVENGRMYCLYWKEYYFFCFISILTNGPSMFIVSSQGTPSKECAFFSQKKVTYSIIFYEWI